MPTIAGYRGFLALWAGGARAPAPPSPPGYRSLLAFWSGGACYPAPGAGYRSMFAFWAGGACSRFMTPSVRAFGAIAGLIRPPVKEKKRDLIEIKSLVQLRMLELVASDPKEAARRGISRELARRSLAARDRSIRLPERTGKEK